MEYLASLEERITSALDRLSPMHKRIARFVLDNRYFMSFASASQAGEKNGVSAATVVRFAQALGFEGYPQFQEALRSELPSYMTATQRMQARLSSRRPPTSTPHQVFYTDIKNIEKTASSLSDSNLNAALDAVQAARRIFVTGEGTSSASKVFLTHSLKVMGFEAESLQGEVLHSVVDLAHIQQNDLLIAIDLWRYVRSTVGAATQAKHAGAKVIAITDSIVSPLAQIADFAFEVATEGVAHSLSLTALMSLINVFIAMLADRAPEQIVASLQKIDSAYRENNLLIMR